MTLAPANFGPFSNDLLVGNFGDGTINAFNPSTGALLGTLAGANGAPIAIDGLLGSRLRQRHQRPTHQHAVLRRRAGRRDEWRLRSHRLPLMRPEHSSRNKEDFTCAACF